MTVIKQEQNKICSNNQATWRFWRGKFNPPLVSLMPYMYLYSYTVIVGLDISILYIQAMLVSEEC